MVPRGLTAQPPCLPAIEIPMHPTPSPIYRPSRLTRLWPRVNVGVGGGGRLSGRAGNFSRKGPSRVLAGGPVSQGPGPQGGRVNGKVLVPGAVAKSSVMRKKLGSEAL